MRSSRLFITCTLPLVLASSVSPALFTDLERASRLSDIAYCVGATTGISKPFDCLSRCSEFPSFELVSSWSTGISITDCAGYLALNHRQGGPGEIVLAFRGTYSITNALIDLSTVPQEYTPYPGRDDDPNAPQDKCDNCTVHIGFNTAWQRMRQRILGELDQIRTFYDNYTTTIIGHSLGGAVAALAALDLEARGFNPIVTTFGEPRTGNDALAKYLDKHFGLLDDADPEKGRYRRVTHIDDPIPLLPLSEWGFRMHAGEIFISKAALSPDVVDLQHCVGDADPSCIASQDSTTEPDDGSMLKKRRALIPSIKHELQDVMSEPWGIPSRYKLWQLFAAHRDYFHRIGLCIPGGDTLGGGHEYPNATAI